MGTQDTEQILVRDNQRESRMDNPETLATLGTQDTEQIHVRDNQRAIKKGQSRDTGNIGYTRHRTNTR